MKVICDRSALMNAINTVSGAVAARSPRVQLSCIHLHAAKSGGVGELTLSATDAEIALKLKLSQVDVSEPGDALIPADKLRARYRNAPNQQWQHIERNPCFVRARKYASTAILDRHPDRAQLQPALAIQS